MPAFVCTRCGQHYPLAETPPEHCVLCEDERFADAGAVIGWTTTQDMRATHFSTFRRLEPGLMGIGTAPHFARGHRAMLLRTTQGNVLWDCPPFLDDATATIVTALGGVAAIATSGPTGHGAMVEWSHAFDSAPIYVHAADRKFVTRPDSSVQFWEAEALELLPGLTLVRCGGQFDGAGVLHWAQGAGGAGTLLVGDTFWITPARSIAFLRSHVNGMPLPVDSVMRMAEIAASLRFETVHGGTWEQHLPRGGQTIIAQAARRFIDTIGVTAEL